MAALYLPSTSVEYITAELVGAPADIESSTVDAALESETVQAEDVSWGAAAWDPEAESTVRWLYDGALPVGTYVFWSRVHDSPETPVRRHGTVYLT